MEYKFNYEENTIEELQRELNNKCYYLIELEKKMKYKGIITEVLIMVSSIYTIVASSVLIYKLLDVNLLAHFIVIVFGGIIIYLHDLSYTGLNFEIYQMQEDYEKVKSEIFIIENIIRNKIWIIII